MSFSDKLRKMLRGDEDNEELFEAARPKAEPEPARKARPQREGRRKLFNPTNALLLVGAILLISLAFLKIGDMGVVSTPRGEKKPASAKVHDVANSSRDESAVVNGMEFSLTDDYYFDWGDSVPGDTAGKLQPSAGNTFLYIRLQVKNVGKEAASLAQKKSIFSSEDLFSYELLYDEQYQYLPVVQDGNASLLQNHTESIIPLQTDNGYVCFEVPNLVAEDENPETNDLALRISSGASDNIWLIR